MPAVVFLGMSRRQGYGKVMSWLFFCLYEEHWDKLEEAVCLLAGSCENTCTLSWEVKGWSGPDQSHLLSKI